LIKALSRTSLADLKYNDLLKDNLLIRLEVSDTYEAEQPITVAASCSSAVRSLVFRLEAVGAVNAWQGSLNPGSDGRYSGTIGPVPPGEYRIVVTEPTSSTSVADLLLVV
jgi:hypothetical protein